MIRVRLNGDERVLRDTALVAALGQLGVDTGRHGVAVALNGTVVRRADWAQTVLEDGDQVEVLSAAQGG